jgi:hypothetical protein
VKLDLTNASLQSFQALFASIRFVIMDEKSTIDLRMLSIIDDRLQLVFPDPADTAFGGLNLLPCGDFFQSPPVSGRALFSVAMKGPEAVKGQVLDSSFGTKNRKERKMSNFMLGYSEPPANDQG